MDCLTLFEENKGLLDNRLQYVKEMISARSKVAVTKTNLSSIKYQVSSELDKSEVSKVALKEMINGDKRVIDATIELENAKCDYEMNKAKVEHVQEIINNNKKMIDSINQDKRFFGG